MGFMVWEGDHKEEFSSYKEDKIGKDLMKINLSRNSGSIDT